MSQKNTAIFDQTLPLRPLVRRCTMDKRAILVVSRSHHGLDVEIMESAAATIIVRSRSIVIWTIDGVQRVRTPQVDAREMRGYLYTKGDLVSVCTM